MLILRRVAEGHSSSVSAANWKRGSGLRHEVTVGRAQKRGISRALRDFGTASGFVSHQKPRVSGYFYFAYDYFCLAYYSTVNS